MSQGVNEQTLVLIKPDGIQRGLVGKICTRFEQKGLKLVAMKMISLDEAILRDDKPAAMKAYRYLKGCGFKEAKAHVECALSNKPNN